MSEKRISTNYVNNKDFLEALIAYKAKCNEADEANLEHPRIPEYIGSCLLKIAKGVSRMPKFSQYSFKEEMIGDGLENVILYLNSFNPEKSQNPFSYFTQIIYWAFVRRIVKERKIRYTTYKYFDSTMMGTEAADYLVDDGGTVVHETIYENLSEFINKFEESEKKKKEKKKALAEAKKATGLFADDDETLEEELGADNGGLEE